MEHVFRLPDSVAPKSERQRAIDMDRYNFLCLREGFDLPPQFLFEKRGGQDQEIRCISISRNHVEEFFVEEFFINGCP